MRKFILAGILAATTLMSAPAFAGVVMNADGSVTTSGTSGGSWTINFDGYGGDSPSVLSGLTSNIVFTYVSGGASSYVFSYVLNNNSSSPMTASRVSGFAFDTNPDISGSSATGLFTHTDAGNYPVGFGNVEFCVNSGGNSCAGGGNGGVTMGNSGSGTFTLDFGSSTSAITLNNFVDRYQSLGGAGAIQSAIGRQVVRDPVPEPATWAMMLLGFGAIGFGMRRRPTAQLLQLA